MHRTRNLIVICCMLLVGCGNEATERQSSATTRSLSWSYDTQTDAMRKQRSWFASNVSTNEAQLSFPYEGGTSAILQLTQDETEDPDNQQAILILQNGQLDCSTCYISLKFDDGKVFESVGTKSDCGSDQCLNVNVSDDIEKLGTSGYVGFHKRLLASRKLVIEVPIYKFGPFQFQFKTSDLVWPQPNAPKQGARSDIISD